MNLRKRYFYPILILAICSCESAILFREAQPFGVGEQNELPTKFIGSYAIDIDKMTNERLPKKLPSYLTGTILIVSSDTLFWIERRTDKVHKDSVDGVRYELINNNLFQDSVQLNLQPVEIEGNYYVYLTKRDTMPMPLNLDTIAIPMLGDNKLLVHTKTVSYGNYFVLNLYDTKSSLWTIIYFELTGSNGLNIKLSKNFSEIDFTELNTLTKNEISGNNYILETRDETTFKKVVDNFFTTMLTLKRVE